MRLLILPFLSLFCSQTQVQSAQPVQLRCEYLHNPVGLDQIQPRLSWKTQTDRRNWMQSAYQIEVAERPDFAPGSLSWDSGKTFSDASLHHVYAGNPLQSTKRYYWRVKVWDEKGQASAWSETAFWEMGLLHESEWNAWWIEPEKEDEPPQYSPASLLRRDFNISRQIRSARVYVTAHGLYELYLNGHRVGEDVLTPGWTAYHKRLQYQVYDVTAYLQQGRNALGAMLGEGWYRSRLGWDNNWGFYGKKLGLLCQLRIEYSDGSSEEILSDKQWKCSKNGPVRKNEIYYGEDYDAQLEIPDWNKAGFDDSKWSPVTLAQHPKNVLVASRSVPIRRIQELRPIAVFQTPKGEWVADMGQNMVGWVKLKVSGQKGKTITLHHAEVLDKKGNFYTDNLRAAKQQIRYTPASDAETLHEPRFTFMGFRYVRVEGLEKPLTADQLTGIVIHSDMPLNGSFECSHPLVNQLQHNIQWGQKGNFLDVPTDCPQRDERLGWTGDAQVFSRTAAYNMDVAAFFTKWLLDLKASQRASGAIPHVIPDALNRMNNEKVQVSAGWGDAGVIIPWNTYEIYDDKRLLEVQYPSMKAYVEYIRKQAGESLIWKGGSIFGDWLFYKPASVRVNDHTSPDAYTNHDLIATAFFAHSAQLVARAAAVLGKKEDAMTYQQLHESVCKVFTAEFCTPSGRMVSESQTAYLLALQFGLLPEAQRPVALKRLCADIRSKNNHLSTGFLGTPYLCHVLTANDSTQMAYDLLFQETYPSWLYPVKRGATTIWERWDGQKLDSTFQDVGMNSFNHYAYGAIGDWMYQVVAGIRMAAPAYKEILIAPEPSEKLSYARASHESPYGTIRSSWERLQGGRIQLSVSIPPNTKATVRLPVSGVENITEGGKTLAAAGLEARKNTRGKVEIVLGSGAYTFTYAP